MEQVEKRRPRRRISPLLLILGMGLLIGLLVFATREAKKPAAPTPTPASVVQTVTLFSYAAEDVVALDLTISGEEGWAVTLDDSGRMQLSGEEGFQLSESKTMSIQQAAATIICEQMVTDDPAEYMDHLADYGLEEPNYVAVITFRDGSVRTLRVGLRPSHTDAWYYMTMDGDDGLYALSRGMVEDLFVSRESLRDVTQPTLHKARIDRLTLQNADGSLLAEWVLTGSITGSDASERWTLTAPFAYPADADAVSKLLSNAANLRLGAYVAPATPENLTACGFDEPRLTLTIHMAAGTMATTGADGVYAESDWPEATVTFVIGGARSDVVDYVLYEGSIYVSSHYSLEVFLEADVEATMNRYPVLTALGNLAALTIDTAEGSVHYALTRTEQVAPNNDLVYDEEGNLVYDVTLTRNGETADYAAFEAAYTLLVGVRTAGVIPEGDAVADTPHTVYTFTDVDGTVNTVALSDYGKQFDAVSVNGHQAFYVVKGGFDLGID